MIFSAVGLPGTLGDQRDTLSNLYVDRSRLGLELCCPQPGLIAPLSPDFADPCKTIGWPLWFPLKLFPVGWFLGPIPPFLPSVLPRVDGVQKG